MTDLRGSARRREPELSDHPSSERQGP
jgi:hypothetical protein